MPCCVLSRRERTDKFQQWSHYDRFRSEQRRDYSPPGWRNPRYGIRREGAGPQQSIRQETSR